LLGSISKDLVEKTRYDALFVFIGSEDNKLSQILPQFSFSKAVSPF